MRVFNTLKSDPHGRLEESIGQVSYEKRKNAAQKYGGDMSSAKATLESETRVSFSFETRWECGGCDEAVGRSAEVEARRAESVEAPDGFGGGLGFK
ncbi:hypothetical protein Scep_018507 [Stephania cephalantha]|uniref:Uncharacterized protein n=1 Tax=Stephania cephalantha TaxID=152367 RepID=A0AAP0I9D9_9MAGN